MWIQPNWLLSSTKPLLCNGAGQSSYSSSDRKDVEKKRQDVKTEDGFLPIEYFTGQISFVFFLAGEMCLTQTCRHHCSSLISSSQPEDAKTTLLIFHPSSIKGHQTTMGIRVNLDYTLALLKYGPLAAQSPSGHCQPL